MWRAEFCVKLPLTVYRNQPGAERKSGRKVTPKNWKRCGILEKFSLHLQYRGERHNGVPKGLKTHVFVVAVLVVVEVDDGHPDCRYAEGLNEKVDRHGAP